MAEGSLEKTSVEQVVKVKRNVGLAHIGPAIEVDKYGNYIKDIKAEVWVSDPGSEITNYLGKLTPEELEFCPGCTTGTHTLVDMGFGEHLIQFTRQGTYRHEEEGDLDYNYYKPCYWGIDAVAGSESPTEGYVDDCGIEEDGLYIPRLERKEPPEYTLKGTILSWEIPPEIFVAEYYNYDFRIMNTSVSDVGTLTAPYRITLEYRSKDLDPEKVYSKVGEWVDVKKDETADITISYAISASAVPSDMVYAFYDIFAILEVNPKGVTW